MKQYIYRFLTAGIIPSDVVTTRKLMIANALLFITSTICLLGAYLNFVVFNSPKLAVLDVIAVLISFFVIVDLRRNHVLDRAIITGSGNLFFLFIGFAYTNQSADFSLIWTIFFPIFVITLMGHKKGLLVTGFFYLILLSMAYQGIGIWDNGEWNFRGFLRLVTASAVLVYIVYVYEAILYHSSIELQQTRDKEAKYIENLHLLSVTDPLTGLYTRRRMNEALQEHVDNFKRYQDPFSLILFDIDDFKHINDHFGHNIGDQVLVIIAESTKNTLRKTDYIGRWGGEEFLILLPKTLKEEAASIAEKLRQEMEAAIYPQTSSVTCSFGVAQYSELLDISGIINQADNALYKAKNSGKNCVCINS